MRGGIDGALVYLSVSYSRQFACLLAAMLFAELRGNCLHGGMGQNGTWPCMNLTLAWIAFGPGALVCLINFCLSFLSYPLHRLRGLPRESYRRRSGFPLFGSLLVALSMPGLHHLPGMIPVAVVLILVDTGGIHWFVGTLIYQRLHGRKHG